MAYTCPYCRLPSEGSDTSCPSCGAPTDVRLRVTTSGWIEQPAIKDMARIRFNRSTCQVSGMYVPVAEMLLDRSDSVYFAHHTLLHAEPSVQLNLMRVPGGRDRRLAGMPLIMITASGPGHLAFSADHPGETIAVPLPANHAIHVVKHRFLVATANVGYQWVNVGVWTSANTGEGEDYHYPLGRTMDAFFTEGGPGLLLLHGHGNTFIRDLRRSERILIQPSALIWKDRTVGLSLHFEYFKVPRVPGWRRTRASTTWLVLEGPGRVAVQSVFERPRPAIFSNSSAATSQFW